MTDERVTYQIVYYGTGMSPNFETWSLRDEAIERAKELKADPRAGFSCLQEVRYIDV